MLHQSCSSDRLRFDWTIDDCPAELWGTGPGHWMCHVATTGKLVRDSTAAVSIWPFEAWKLYCLPDTPYTSTKPTLEFHFEVTMSRRKQSLEPTSADFSSFAMVRWVFLIAKRTFETRWQTHQKMNFNPNFFQVFCRLVGFPESGPWSYSMFYVLPIFTCDSYDAHG